MHDQCICLYIGGLSKIKESSSSQTVYNIITKETLVESSGKASRITTGDLFYDFSGTTYSPDLRQAASGQQ